MTRMILILIIFIILTACSRTNLLTYKNRKYYKEYSIITSDTVFKLVQKVCYNRPNVIDEEFCHDLSFTFLDTLAAKTKRNINLLTDTAIVRSKYGIFSVWNWDDNSKKVTGDIEIISWKNGEITLKENVLTTDFKRNKIKKFIGTRTFKRKEGW